MPVPYKCAFDSATLQRLRTRLGSVSGMDGTAIAGIVIGLGATIAAMVMPLKFPNAPEWAVDLAWWGGLALVGGGILYLFVKWLRIGRLTLGFAGLFDCTISLNEAARKLYEEMRGTDVGRLIEGHASAPNIFDNAAGHILEHVPLEVKWPPSTKWETLTKSEASQLMPCNDATGLRKILADEPICTEVRLRRKDLRRLIREYKET
jgi:hypothetical protein